MARTKAFDKQEVLEKAMMLFWDKGYFDTSMQDLVDHLGINRSSIYDTFTDKHGLFLASLDHYKNSGTTTIDQDRATDLNLFLTEFLHSIVDSSLKDERQKGCFLVNCSVELAAKDEQVNAIVHENMAAFVNSFQDLFDHHKKQGNLPESKNSRALANFLYGTMSSIKLISRTTKDRSILEDIAKTAIAAILK